MWNLALLFWSTWMKTKRPFVSTIFFTLLGRSGGLVIPFFIAKIYGAGRQTDVFFLAYGLVFSLIGILTHIFESVLIPYLNQFKKDSEYVYGLANGILIVIFPVLMILCLMIGMGLEPLLIGGSRWEPASAHGVQQMFYELAPLIFLGGLISSANSIFFSYKIFWFPSFSPFLRSLIVIGMLLSFHHVMGIHALTSGFVLGETIRWGVGTFLLLRLTPWKVSVNWGKVGPLMKEVHKHSFFQLLALVGIHLIYVADQWFASTTGPGNLSLLSYADRLLQIPYGLFLSGLIQIFLSYWSESYYFEASPSFWNKISKDLRRVLILGAGIGVILLVFREFFIRLFYGWGRLSPAQLHELMNIFGWLSVGLIADIARLLYSRLLFVMKKSHFYLLVSWIQLLFKLLLNFIFVRLFGIVGIAISTAVVYTLAALTMHFYIRQFSSQGVFEK